MQSFLTATAHFALFLVPCLLTTVIHIVTGTTRRHHRTHRLTRIERDRNPEPHRDRVPHP